MNFNKIIFKDPFERLRGNKHESKILSWTKPFDYEVFYEILRITRPSSIIELGSFLGYSTITMLKICQEMNLTPQMVCVDTWLGGADHYINYDKKTDDLFFQFFKLDEGISKTFDQFCINIINERMDDQVIPFPNTTDNAFLYFKHLKVSADLIFVDASHVKSQVYNDIKNYYSLLNMDGTMFGHDINWDDVKEAVEQFCGENSLTYKTFHNKYWMINPII